MPDGMYHVEALVPGTHPFTLTKAVAYFRTKGQKAESARSENGGRGFRVFTDDWAIVAWYRKGTEILLENRDRFLDDSASQAKIAKRCNRSLSIWSDEDPEGERVNDWGIFVDDLLAAFGGIVVFDPVLSKWWDTKPATSAKPKIREHDQQLLSDLFDLMADPLKDLSKMMEDADDAKGIQQAINEASKQIAVLLLVPITPLTWPAADLANQHVQKVPAELPNPTQSVTFPFIPDPVQKPLRELLGKQRHEPGDHTDAERKELVHLRLLLFLGFSQVT